LNIDLVINQNTIRQ